MIALLIGRQLLRRICQLPRKTHLHQPGKGSVCAPPDRNGGLNRSSSFFREPNNSAAKILFDNGDLDQSLPLKPAQIPGESRLIQARPNRKRAKSIIRGNRNLRHQAEL